MRAAVGAIVVLALVGVGASVVGALLVPGGSMSVVGGADASDGGDGTGSVPGDAAPGDARSGDDGADAPLAPSEASVIVHVLGSVREPGIVEVRLGDRVVDAIAAAGGATDAADLGGVNLARELVDGEQVYVPAIGEVPPGGPAPPGGATGAGGSGGAPGALVDLNTADAAALDALPGIGPAIAGRIIEWREQNGPFRAVDELLAVSGIGEKTLSEFRDRVTV
ncbi:hypothetical protein GCM10009792_23210 [Microcella alkalica]